MLLVDSISSFRNRSRTRDKFKKLISFKLFYCHECKKEFSRPDALKAHQRYHFAPFKYACKTCDKKFQVQADYQNHIKRGDCGGSVTTQTTSNQQQPVQDKLKDSKRKPRKVRD
jgi:DNA-directed RNA polymerase subunit RPC12/RpoP